MVLHRKMKSAALAKGILEFVTGGVMSELKILELWESVIQENGDVLVSDFPGNMNGTDVFRVVNYAYAHSKGWCEISPDGWKRVQEVEQCLSDLLSSSQGAN
jgi:hypothetical protein